MMGGALACCRNQGFDLAGWKEKIMRALPKGRWPWLLTGLFLSLFPLGGHYQAADAQDSKQDSQPKVEVKVVKYDALGKAITQLRGKVVVVDFWATT